MTTRHHFARIGSSSSTGAASLVITGSGTDALYKPTNFGLVNGTSCNVVLTINSGVWLGGGGTVASLTFDDFGSGSTIRLNNAGTVAGYGGGGGVTFFASDSGDPGGDAIEVIGSGITLTIDNSLGYIFGGGGGGARGANGSAGVLVLGGGGGGGGQGNPGGSGGSGIVTGFDGANGSNGSTSGAGSGGAGGTHVSGASAEAGASGGSWGLDGGSTSAAYGGTAGYAIRLNGNSIAWVGGNNGTQVKGTVG